MRALFLVLTVLLLVVACEQEASGPLTEDQELNLRLAEAENVKSFGAPPMIPSGHSFEIGNDVAESENGGDVCLECHYADGEEDAPQTLHPERHNCLQCHIPDADETATEEDFKVENTFEKFVPAHSSAGSGAGE